MNTLSNCVPAAGMPAAALLRCAGGAMPDAELLNPQTWIVVKQYLCTGYLKGDATTVITNIIVCWRFQNLAIRARTTSAVRSMDQLNKVKTSLINFCKKVLKNDVLVQYRLGNNYLDSKDYENAVKWWKKSAEQGYAPAHSSSTDDPTGAAGSGIQAGIARKNSGESYVVKPGDTLAGIAKKVYGNVERRDVIILANPELQKNPNSLKPGMKLVIPKI